ncbi:unnamed protein product [Heterosigma akashiwo]|uniref:U3 small nucleolar ribonucleoprotein protein IMP3 n=1 Tax=Heterosigma akashiwo TaxID=2829 RepID=A0A6S9JYI8_HETAK|mmetsp:Transcript_4962/g.7351  ORF Transcript_4962/g.7351 Transcript_4962/m.7351 type:complete len:184 (-) Transcript_4962:280-831(-)|eukprot:CAMPEP_0194594086 /NCGR_PEP_ID=MMETSP0292-20121207/23974_1 /TAXON_ID=39354 /ORGANISM="Heterosigma akashiwo, Strain CCMP2393" /LENGTH=183 /DNA_ID=CAMNT_0039453329 /DNA_START=70 /DNA_END=621 /DNA_ORIENTATION=-
MRKLKHHEQKLLKKVDFLQWKSDQNIREIKIIRRYLLQDREDYTKYNKICGHMWKLVAKLRALPPTDQFRIKMTEDLLEKLFNMGVINSKKSLQLVEKVNVSAFCRRRLPVVMVRLKMSETIKEAITFIEHGHVRVGPHCVTDPAFLVPRAMEDFLTWVDSSKIKRTIMKYNDKLDDYDLLGN